MTDRPAACDSHRENLAGLLYGDLDAPAAHELHEHLATCQECSAEFEKLRRVRDLMQQARRLSVPVGLEARVMSEARAALESRAPAASAAPRPGSDRDRGTWLTRLLSPMVLRPAAAALLTVLLVAGVYMLVRDRKGSVMQRYTQKPALSLPEDQAAPAAPPRPVSDQAPSPQGDQEQAPTPGGVTDETLSASTDESGAPGVDRNAPPTESAQAATLVGADTIKDAGKQGKTQTKSEDTALGDIKSGFSTQTGTAMDQAGEDDLLASKPGSGKFASNATATGGASPSDDTPKVAGAGDAADKLFEAPALESEPLAEAPGPASTSKSSPPPKGGMSGGLAPSKPAPKASSTPAPAPAPTPTPTLAPPPGPAKAMAPADEEMAVYESASSGEDADASPKPAEGGAGLSWYEKYKQKKAEKKAKKQDKAKDKGAGKKKGGAKSASEPAAEPAAEAEKPSADVGQPPSDPFEQAMALKKAKKYDEAIALLKKMKDDPSSTQASPAKVYHQLAATTASAGDPKKALVYYENLFARWPGYPGSSKAMWEAAQLYVSVGDRPAARKLLEKLVEDPTYSEKAKKKLQELK